MALRRHGDVLPSLRRSAGLAAAALAAAAFALAAQGESLRIGSKRFNEAYIFGENLAQAAPRGGGAAGPPPGPGNTALLYEGLTHGHIESRPGDTRAISPGILEG